MSAHTTGKLEAIGNLVRTSMAEGGFLVAEFRDSSGQPHNEEAKANAVLFCAANDLLKSLQKVTEALAARLGTNAEEWAEVNESRAAIAKATGGAA